MAIDAKFANMTFAELEQLLTAQMAVEYLGTLGVEISADRLRNLARKGTVPGAGIVMKKPAFVKSALTDWTPPESTGIIRRADGRRPYTIYLLPETEHPKLVEEGYEFKPKKKRKPRKAKAESDQAEQEAAPNAGPFDAFGE